MSWQLASIDSIKSDAPYSLVGGPFGSNLTTRDYTDEGVPVIRGGNLPDTQTFLDGDFVFVREEKADALIANLAYPGDLVFTQRGTLGQVGLIPKEARFQRYVISQSQMKLTVDETKTDPWFVYYYFRHPDTVQTVKNHALTSGVPHINLGILKSLQMPLPPLGVQRNVVGLLSSYDDLIENNRRRMALLEEAARQLYREWFVRLRFPGHEHANIIEGVPEGWGRKTFNEVCQAVGGGTPSTTKPEYWDDGNIIWVTPTDITRNPCLALLDSEKKITEAGLKSSSAKMLPPDTIMMTSRASVGFFGLIDRPACTNQGFISVIPNEPLSRMYLLHNLMHRVEEIRSHAGGATYKEISKRKFKALPVVMPFLSLLRDFEEQATELLRQVRTLHTMNARLSQARDLLLPRLMSGEIAV